MIKYKDDIGIFIGIDGFSKINKSNVKKYNLLI